MIERIQRRIVCSVIKWQVQGYEGVNRVDIDRVFLFTHDEPT